MSPRIPRRDFLKTSLAAAAASDTAVLGSRANAAEPAGARLGAFAEPGRGLPTVWDETVVLNAEVAKQIVIARRSGERRWLAAINGDAAVKISVPLKFLGAGQWELRSFADASDSAAKPESVVEKTRTVDGTESLLLELAPAGGYAAKLTKK